MKSSKLITIALLLISAFSQAQTDPLFMFRDIYQSGNPAYISNSTITVGFPMLSNIQSSISMPIKFTDFLVKNNTTGDWDIDYNKLENSLNDKNFSTLELNTDILYAGYRLDRNYFSFRWSYKSFSEVRFPLDLISMRHGNWDEATDKIIQYDINDLAINSISYSEIALGWSAEVSKQLKFGVAVKVLTGGMNIQTKQNHWNITTSEGLYYTELQGKYQVQTSMPLDVSIDNEGYVSDVAWDSNSSLTSLLFNKNFGLAIDLGVDYEVNDQLSVAAYLKDFGFMNWRESTNTFRSEFSFDYKGLYVTPATIQDEDFEFFKNLGDSIDNASKITPDSSAYTTYLPQTLYITGNYEINDMVNVGAMLKNRIYNKHYYPEFTLASSVKPSEWFCGTASIGFNKNSFAKIGLGAQFNAGPVQLFILSDNVPGFVIDNSKAVGLSFGINFIFGEKYDQ